MNHISNKTKIFGIIGNPLSHTLSPMIHNFLFKEYGYDGFYLVFETENPDKTIIALQNLKISGLSVTIPYKEWAYSVSNTRDDVSEWMKASNTIKFENEKISAYNTDGYGALRAVKENSKKVFDSNILIIGSGGSARGIAFSFLHELKSNCKIFISSRNFVKASELISLLNELRAGIAHYIPLENISDIKENTSLVINTTPVGMKGQSQEILLPDSFLSKNHTLFDIVYNPPITPLLKLAKKRKSKIILGYEMLVYQAIKQFKIFTEIEVENKVIAKIKAKVFKKLHDS